MKRIGVPSLLMSSEEQTDGDNESEWKALMAAFQMYRAAYGDLKVPARFVVPSMPPWPSEYNYFEYSLSRLRIWD